MGNALKLIRYIEQDVDRLGFSLELFNARYIDIGDGAPSSGYFSESERKIVACLKAKDFIGILVHEYCHFRQFVEDKEQWDYANNAYEKMYDWLDGKRVKNIKDHLKIVQALELDCEKRAVAMFAKWDVGVDKKHYIKGANAYMYFFEYLAESRKWCHPYNTPSNNDALLMLMPTTFVGDYTMTDLIRKTFKHEGI